MLTAAKWCSATLKCVKWVWPCLHEQDWQCGDHAWPIYAAHIESCWRQSIGLFECRLNLSGQAIVAHLQLLSRGCGGVQVLILKEVLMWLFSSLSTHRRWHIALSCLWSVLLLLFWLTPGFTLISETLHFGTVTLHCILSLLIRIHIIAFQ